MDKFLIKLNKFLSKAKIFLYEVYYKLCFFFNKQMTLQKMYVPLTESKTKANKELSLKLSTLKNESNFSAKSSEKLVKENMLLKSKISSLQELLLKK